MLFLHHTAPAALQSSLRLSFLLSLSPSLSPAVFHFRGKRSESDKKASEKDSKVNECHLPDERRLEHALPDDRRAGYQPTRKVNGNVALAVGGDGSKQLIGIAATASISRTVQARMTRQPSNRRPSMRRTTD